MAFFLAATNDPISNRVPVLITLGVCADGGEDAALLSLYGLLRSGQIVLRPIDGRHDMVKPKPEVKAA
jgi:hypothetical protein